MSDLQKMYDKQIRLSASGGRGTSSKLPSGGSVVSSSRAGGGGQQIRNQIIDPLGGYVQGERVRFVEAIVEDLLLMDRRDHNSHGDDSLARNEFIGQYYSEYLMRIVDSLTEEYKSLGGEESKEKLLEMVNEKITLSEFLKIKSEASTEAAAAKSAVLSPPGPPPAPPPLSRPPAVQPRAAAKSTLPPGPSSGSGASAPPGAAVSPPLSRPPAVQTAPESSTSPAPSPARAPAPPPASLSGTSSELLSGPPVESLPPVVDFDESLVDVEELPPQLEPSLSSIPTMGEASLFQTQSFEIESNEEEDLRELSEKIIVKIKKNDVDDGFILNIEPMNEDEGIPNDDFYRRIIDDLYFLVLRGYLKLNVEVFGPSTYSGLGLLSCAVFDNGVLNDLDRKYFSGDNFHIKFRELARDLREKEYEVSLIGLSESVLQELIKDSEPLDFDIITVKIGQPIRNTTGLPDKLQSLVDDIDFLEEKGFFLPDTTLFKRGDRNLYGLHVSKFSEGLFHDLSEKYYVDGTDHQYIKFRELAHDLRMQKESEAQASISQLRESREVEDSSNSISATFSRTPVRFGENNSTSIYEYKFNSRRGKLSRLTLGNFSDFISSSTVEAKQTIPANFFGVYARDQVDLLSYENSFWSSSSDVRYVLNFPSCVFGSKRVNNNNFGSSVLKEFLLAFQDESFGQIMRSLRQIDFSGDVTNSRIMETIDRLSQQFPQQSKALKLLKFLFLEFKVDTKLNYQEVNSAIGYSLFSDGEPIECLINSSHIFVLNNIRKILIELIGIENERVLTEKLVEPGYEAFLPNHSVLSRATVNCIDPRGLSGNFEETADHTEVDASKCGLNDGPLEGVVKATYIFSDLSSIRDFLINVVGINPDNGQSTGNEFATILNGRMRVYWANKSATLSSDINPEEVEARSIFVDNILKTYRKMAQLEKVDLNLGFVRNLKIIEFINAVPKLKAVIDNQMSHYRDKTLEASIKLKCVYSSLLSIPKFANQILTVAEGLGIYFKKEDFNAILKIHGYVGEELDIGDVPEGKTAHDFSSAKEELVGSSPVVPDSLSSDDVTQVYKVSCFFDIYEQTPERKNEFLQWCNLNASPPTISSALIPTKELGPDFSIDELTFGSRIDFDKSKGVFDEGNLKLFVQCLFLEKNYASARNAKLNFLSSEEVNEKLNFLKESIGEELYVEILDSFRDLGMGKLNSAERFKSAFNRYKKEIFSNLITVLRNTVSNYLQSIADVCKEHESDFKLLLPVGAAASAEVSDASRPSSHASHSPQSPVQSEEPKPSSKIADRLAIFQQSQETASSKLPPKTGQAKTGKFDSISADLTSKLSTSSSPPVVVAQPAVVKPPPQSAAAPVVVSSTPSGSSTPPAAKLPPTSPEPPKVTASPVQPQPKPTPPPTSTPSGAPSTPPRSSAPPSSTPSGSSSGSSAAGAPPGPAEPAPSAPAAAAAMKTPTLTRAAAPPPKPPTASPAKLAAASPPPDRVKVRLGIFESQDEVGSEEFIDSHSSNSKLLGVSSGALPEKSKNTVVNVVSVRQPRSGKSRSKPR